MIMNLKTACATWGSPVLNKTEKLRRRVAGRRYWTLTVVWSGYSLEVWDKQGSPSSVLRETMSNRELGSLQAGNRGSLAAFGWKYRTPVSPLLGSPMTLCGRCHGITQEDMGKVPISAPRPYHLCHHNSPCPPPSAQKMRKRFAGPSHHLLRGWLAGCRVSERWPRQNTFKKQ